jgi:glyoxylase-like metal-dependent hydrolase (beta-lactamase superfamily II)
MKTLFRAVPIGLVAVLGVVFVPLDARQRSESPMVKLYVLDCGTLKDRDPGTYNLTRDQVQSTDMSDPCFLVVHARGSLLWETGLNDATFNRPGGGPRGDTVDRSLKSQLEQIGFRTQSITYLAMSHSHGDHSGNANDYAAATWLVQRAEHANMFRTDAASPAADPAAYAALKNSKTVLLDGDHDVFGDGTVVLKATPGHTPGHQSLFVRLAKTGPLMLSGDLYHFPAERTLKKMPTREAANGQTATSREKLEAFMRDTGAALWIQHDMIAYRGLKLAPAHYE